MRKVSFLLLFIIIGSTVNAQLRLDLESGIVSTGYNDVRIPGKGGTMLSLKDELTADSKVYFRAKLNYTIGRRHNISVLYAPLTIISNGNLPKDVNFAETNFPIGTKVKATYKFNSYRLTYRYDIVESQSFEFGLGLTAKIRDAKITMQSDDLIGEKKNVGFVPLVNFRIHWHPTNVIGFLLDGDALAAPQGRAEDVLAGMTFDFSKHIGMWGGYRILEGGADNNSVYTFSLFNYYSVGLYTTF
jgi:hypothetical protein